MSIGLVIPVGPGRHERLGHTLRSCVAQSGSDLDLAICSVTDDPFTLEAINQSKALATYHRQGPDRGQSDAIIEGWTHLDSDILGWLNADDILAPQTIAMVKDAFDRLDHVDMIYGQSLIMEDSGGIIGLHPAIRPPTMRLYYDDIISQPSAFIRRSALDRIGGLERDLHYTMDWDLFIRLMEDGASILYLDEVLSGVVWGEDTKTGSLLGPRAKELMQALRRNNGPVRQLKSLIGFTQHHLSTYRRTALGPPTSWPEPTERGSKTISLPIWHANEGPAVAVTVEGRGITGVSLATHVGIPSGAGTFIIRAPFNSMTLYLLTIERMAGGTVDKIAFEMVSEAG